MTEARCPKCGIRSSTPALGKERWYCHRCLMEFEAIDDGDVGYKTPSRIVEQRERRDRRRKKR